MTKRLAILQNSLKKKETRLEKLNADYGEYQRKATIASKDTHLQRQCKKRKEQIAQLKESITITQNAIEKEKTLIANIENFAVPEPFKKYLDNGTLIQRRKFPHIFCFNGFRYISIRYDKKTHRITCAKLNNIANQTRRELVHKIYSSLKTELKEIQTRSNTMKEKSETTQRMTNLQLAEWTAKGNGLFLEDDIIYEHFYCNKDFIEKPVSARIKIRRWHSAEWMEPTFDVYEKDCKNA